MPRSPRLLLSRSYYHIITRGNNRLRIFKSPGDYQYYLDLVKKYQLAHPFNLFHYCLMPDHVHFLMRTGGKSTEFSKFMKRLNLAYFAHYQQSYKWVGHLWQGRFKSQPVGKDEYFIQCGKYIELNPVRAGLVKKPEHYNYSSYRFYVSGEKNEIVTPDFVYKSLGKSSRERQKKYQSLVVADITVKSYQKDAWGSREQRYNEVKKASNYWVKKLEK